MADEIVDGVVPLSGTPKIFCRNVIKVTFQDAPPQPNNNSETQFPADSSEGNSSDSASTDDSIEIKLVDVRAGTEVGTGEKGDSNNNELIGNDNVIVAHNLPAKIIRPPRAKQLQNIRLLLNQYNERNRNSDFLFLINTKWLDTWLNSITSTENAPVDGRGSEITDEESEGILEVPPIDNYALLDAKSRDMLRSRLGASVVGGSENGGEYTQEGIVVTTTTTSGVDPNLELLDEEDLAQFYLHYSPNMVAGVKEHTDFICLPKEAWDALQGWYGGGPPLPRRLIKKSNNNNNNNNSNGASGSSGGTGFEDLLDVSLPSPLADSPSKKLLPAAHQQHSTQFALELYPEDGCVPSVQDVLYHMADYNSNNGEDDQSYGGAYLGGGVGVDVGGGRGGAAAAKRDGHSAGMSAMSSSMSLSSFASAVDLVAGTTGSGDEKREGIVEDESKAKSKEVVVVHTCFVCSEVAKMRCSKCTCIYYCGLTCQKLHWKFHKSICCSDQQVVLKASIDQGKIGLFNLGNSCYMNSSIHCLSHIKPLTQHFLSQHFKGELNRENRDGTGGLLCDAYFSLLQELWFGKRGSAIPPRNFKATLGAINEEYAGTAQQDAHEVIEQLLDKLHEDLNRVGPRKPPGVYSDNDEEAEIDLDAMAAETWRLHARREDSVVKDLVGGLIQSKVTCPDCGKVSISFEYHNTVQLAIPRETSKIIRVVFVPEVFADPTAKNKSVFSSSQLFSDTSPIQFTVTLDRLHAVSMLRDAVRKNIPPRFVAASRGEVLLFEADLAVHHGSTVKRSLGDTMPVSRLGVDGGQCLVYAYCPIFELDCRVIVLNRLISPVFSATDKPPSPSKHTPSINGSAMQNGRIKVELVGVPMMISYDRSWTCTRLRYQVWLNVVRMVSKASPSGKAILQALKTASVMDQIGMSKSLDLHLVDPLARGVILKNSAASHNNEKKSNAKLEFLSKLMLSPLATHIQARVKEKWMTDIMTLDADADAAVIAEPASLVGGVRSMDLATEIGMDIPNDKETMFVNAVFDRISGPAADELKFLSVDWLGERAAHLDQDFLKEWPTTTTRRQRSHSVSGGEASSDKLKKVREKVSHSFTLQQCLGEHTKEEILGAGNEWYCNVCKEHKAAKKVHKFCERYLPEVLVLSLKRFEFRDISDLVGRQGAAHREKIDTFVDFPLEELDLLPYCSNSSSSNGVSSSSSSSCNKTSYDLFAVCNHYGRMGLGHYTAAARDMHEWNGLPTPARVKEAIVKAHANANAHHQVVKPTDYNPTVGGPWFCFDDRHVFRCGIAEHVVTPGAYILFYRKRPNA